MKQNSLKNQRGVSLLIVLLLLLIMTLLGLAGLRSTIMQEKMSGNLLDRSVAFQSAESAIREAEGILATLPTPVFPTSGACVNGLCPTPIPSTSTLERWKDPAFTGWRNAAVAVGPLSASPPQFFIEPLGLGDSTPRCGIDSSIPVETCKRPRYRIIARGTDPTNANSANRAQVILTSNYALP